MGKWFKGLLWTAGILALVAGGLRATVLRAWKVPDDPLLAAALAPTMDAGDTVLLLTRGTPGFGELVRCPDPEDASKFVVGRIVGVEGDVVETEGPNVAVNGRKYSGENACKETTFKVKHPSSGSDV